MKQVMKEIKDLYTKDKDLAKQVAKVLGYRIVEAKPDDATNADTVFKKLNKENSLKKYTKKDIAALAKEFQLSNTMAKKLYQKIQSWDQGIVGLMQAYGLTRRDAEEAYESVIKKYVK